MNQAPQKVVGLRNQEDPSTPPLSRRSSSMMGHHFGEGVQNRLDQFLLSHHLVQSSCADTGATDVGQVKQ
ncbi:MAG: hypothetical protein WC058_10100 [Phycisphaeraceae bacterium]